MKLERNYIAEGEVREFRGVKYVRVRPPGEVYEDAAMERVYPSLASQYVLGYASSNPRRDGGWRRLNVQVNRTGTTARTKRGYFAPVS